MFQQYSSHANPACSGFAQLTGGGELLLDEWQKYSIAL